MSAHMNSTYAVYLAYHDGNGIETMPTDMLMDVCDLLRVTRVDEDDAILAVVRDELDTRNEADQEAQGVDERWHMAAGATQLIVRDRAVHEHDERVCAEQNGDCACVPMMSDRIVPDGFTAGLFGTEYLD